MKVHFLILYFSLGLTLLSGMPNQILSINVDFFSEQIQLNYHPSILLAEMVRVEEKSMVNFFQQLEKSNYQVLLDDLIAKKQQFQLNDWLSFSLLNKSLDDLFDRQHALQQRLTAWFFLSKMGFDTRLTYLGQKVFIYVYTNDEVFEVPLIEDKGRKFVNLSGINQPTNPNEALYLLNFSPNAKGKSFSFYLDQLPTLSPIIHEQTYTFNYKDTTYQLIVKTDQTVKELMSAYPIFAETKYLEVPFSKAIATSLLPQLEKILERRSEKEKLELLAAFTRSSFNYMEDKKVFGKSKPMIADELFLYPYSDCEDRSALYYALVKNLLNLPMIIIAFSDHLTLGVATNELSGPAIAYKGKHYFICDPTGPANSSAVGQFPQGYEQKKFHIIGEYK
ncbi:MAG: hypothetical protein R2828_26225 [Saprospiraceae bacterium]